jgi:hypothetical protein
VPLTAAQLVAPDAVNCCVLVSATLTEDGEMAGGMLLWSVTFAEVEPAELEAVTVSAPDAGIVPGAV